MAMSKADTSSSHQAGKDSEDLHRAKWFMQGVFPEPLMYILFAWLGENNEQYEQAGVLKEVIF